MEDALEWLIGTLGLLLETRVSETAEPLKHVLGPPVVPPPTLS